MTNAAATCMTTIAARTSEDRQPGQSRRVPQLTPHHSAPTRLSSHEMMTEATNRPASSHAPVLAASILPDDGVDQLTSRYGAHHFSIWAAHSGRIDAEAAQIACPIGAEAT